MSMNINNTNDSTVNTGLNYSKSIVYVMMSFEILLVPIIAVGNGLILAAVCRYKALHHSSNVMIASLSISDFLMGTVFIPTKLLSSISNVSKFACLINIFNSYVCISLAMTFLSMLSIERFYAVQFPFHYHSHMTTKTSVIWCVVIFTGIIALMLPILCGVDTWEYSKYCFNTNILPRFYIWTCLSIMSMFLLLGFLGFLRVVFAEIQVRKMTNRQHAQTEFRKQDSVKSTLMIMVYVFSVFCWLPQIVYVFWSAFNPRDSNLFALRAVSIVGLCSSGANFFIYGVKNSKFRLCFRKMFGCKISSIEPSTSIDTIAT